MIENPILPGFHPDPSALRVGDDYYIATSTFEWWPGVEIYHSKDLANWELVCQPLDRMSQVDLRGDRNSGGIWAPHLSYCEGVYYLAYTDVKGFSTFLDACNYVITAPDITGPWSDPVFVTASGFDPSLFHDDDGKHYFLNMLYDWRCDQPHFAGTVIQEFDADAKKLVGKRQHFYYGNHLGVCEGPQILKKDGWYYLLCAAGGTGYQHAATVARSRTLLGNYEESPYFPLLSSSDDPDNVLQKSGHACFLQFGEDWYITHLCARPLTKRGSCVLGRETALQKIEWHEGWPRLIHRTHKPMCEIPIAADVRQSRGPRCELVDFSNLQIPNTMKTLHRALIPEIEYSLSARPGWLRLYGGASLQSLHGQSLLARRWQAFDFDAETWLEFSPDNFQQMAGLILYYDTDNWCYAHLTRNEPGSSLYIRVLQCRGGCSQYCCEPQSVLSAELLLSVKVRHGMAQWSYTLPGGEEQYITDPQPVDYLSDEGATTDTHFAFTGAMVGICCQDMDNHTAFADFRSFAYCEKSTEDTAALLHLNAGISTEKAEDHCFKRIGQG